MSAFKKYLLVTGSLLLVFSFLLVTTNFTVVGQDEDSEGLTTLHFKIDGGTYNGQPVVYWYRFKNIDTEEEVFRLDVITDAGEEAAVILDKRNDSVYFKEMGTGSWQQLPGMMLGRWWDQYREPYISPDRGAPFWRDIEDQEKYVIEDEEHRVTIYDVEVDEPIEDSVFTPVS